MHASSVARASAYDAKLGAMTENDRTLLRQMDGPLNTSKKNHGGRRGGWQRAESTERPSRAELARLQPGTAQVEGGGVREGDASEREAQGQWDRRGSSGQVSGAFGAHIRKKRT